jgi:hypothetical protein
LAWWFGIRVIRLGKFAILILLQRAGAMFLGRSKRGLDGDKLRPRCNLTVDG